MQLMCKQIHRILTTHQIQFWGMIGTLIPDAGNNFPVSSFSMKFKPPCKTTKMTNARGHKFTSITLTLIVRYQQMWQLILNTCVSIYVHFSLLYCKRRWSIVIPQVQNYPLWVKYLFKHVECQCKCPSTTY